MKKKFTKKIAKTCPNCESSMDLVYMIFWGKSKKYDREWLCFNIECQLKITEKGVD